MESNETAALLQDLGGNGLESTTSDEESGKEVEP